MVSFEELSAVSPRIDVDEATPWMVRDPGGDIVDAAGDDEPAVTGGVVGEDFGEGKGARLGGRGGEGGGRGCWGRSNGGELRI